MIIDLSIAGIVVFFGILGYFSGALKQIFKIVAIVAAYFLAKFAANAFYMSVAEKYKVPEQIAYIITSAIAWFIIALILSIIVSVVIKLIHKSGGDTLRGVDRFGGLMLAAIKTIVFLYLSIGAMSSYKLVTEKKFPEMAKNLDKSILVGFVEENNMVKKLFWIDYTSRLADISLLPEVQSKLSNDPAFGAILNKPQYKEQIERIGQKGVSQSLLNDKLTRELMQDKDFQKYIVSEKVEGWIKDAKLKQENIKK